MTFTSRFRAIASVALPLLLACGQDDPGSRAEGIDLSEFQPITVSDVGLARVQRLRRSDRRRR
jgi:hypothetical protein